jgi:hypothetical protein
MLQREPLKPIGSLIPYSTTVGHADINTSTTMIALARIIK